MAGLLRLCLLGALLHTSTCAGRCDPDRESCTPVGLGEDDETSLVQIAKALRVGRGPSADSKDSVEAPKARAAREAPSGWSAVNQSKSAKSILQAMDALSKKVAGLEGMQTNVRDMMRETKALAADVKRDAKTIVAEAVDPLKSELSKLKEDMASIKHRTHEKKELDSPETYEYIVVGSGSAGSAIAGKLAKAGKSVLLLEAGPDDDWTGKDIVGDPANPLVPMNSTIVQYSPDINDPVMSEPVWPFERELDPLLMAMQKNITRSKPLSFLEEWMPRARIVGGCSMHNWMIWMRPSPDSHDSWGLDTWKWDKVFPKYKAMETDLETHVDMKYHGSGGENYVATPPLYDADKAWLLAAANVTSLPRNGDFNGRTRLGIGPLPKSLYKGRRWSSSKAFLTPDVRKLQNFHLRTQGAATKVIFNGTRAIGINYVDVDLRYKRVSNVTRTVLATNEIILSAGSFRSPQLLLLSGIGPSANFQLHPELPRVAISEGVGQNLQDHLILENTVSVNAPLIMPQDTPRLDYDYGPIGGHYFSSWCKSHNCSSPDMQLICGNGPGNRSFSCYVGLYGHVQSDPGFLRLKSLDPLEYPSIFMKYLGAKEDVDRFAEGAQMIHKIFKSDPQTFGETPPSYPGDKMSDSDYDDPHRIREYVRRHATTVYHPVGTCKMGPASDNMAVVDESLKVHGVHGLRVADASIMPTITDSNTDQPTRLIGYHVADMILEKKTHEALVFEAGKEADMPLIPMLDLEGHTSLIPGRQEGQRVWRRLRRRNH